MLVLSKRHWLLGTLVALLIYACVAIAVLWRMPAPTQAANTGKSGIVISLESASGSPAQEQTTAETVEEVEPEPETKQEPKPTQKVKPKPKLKLQPKAKPSIPVTKVGKQKIPEHKANLSQEHSQTPKVSGNKNQQDNGSSDATPDGEPGQLTDYMASIQTWLEHQKKYPRRARRRHQEGTALLYFVIDRQGNVLKHELRQSSGHQLLDREVLNMIKRANPLPAMPASMPQTTLELLVPLQFKLR